MENTVRNTHSTCVPHDVLREFASGDLPPQLLDLLSASEPWKTLASLDAYFQHIDTVKFWRQMNAKAMLEKVASMPLTAILKGSAETCADVEDVNNANTLVPLVPVGPVIAIKAPRTALTASPGQSGTLRIPWSYIGQGQCVRMLHRGMYEGNMAVLYDETSSVWALVVLVGWGMKDSKAQVVVQCVRVLTRPDIPVPLDPHFSKNRPCMCESDALVPSFYHGYMSTCNLSGQNIPEALKNEKRNVELVVALLNTSVHQTLFQHLLFNPTGVKLQFSK